MAASVELRAAGRRYEGVAALAPTSLRVEPGETLVLLGSSGCGKSTLLRLVLGLVEPDEGEVWVGDARVERASALAVRRRMGYVPQDGGLFPHLRAGENAELVARHLGWSAARRRERVESLAALVRLPPRLLERYPGELSGGQRQRVSLMRALMLGPDLVLLDEPLGALDPLVRDELQRDLREVFRAAACTVLLVTHDLREAAFFAHRVALMHEGRVVQLGTIDELEARPAEPFVSRFLGVWK